MSPNTDAVLAAMMNDLGLGRMEDLAKDDDRHRRSNLDHLPLPASSQTPRYTADIDPRAKAWNDAVAANTFRDDDSRALDGLDSIANGRLHAMRKGSQPPTGGGHYAGRGRGDHSNTGPAKSDHFKVGSYDPSNPNFHGRGQSSSRRPPHINNAYQLSSHGGIIPPGAEVRRWSAKQSIEAIKNLTNREPPSPRQARPPTAVHPSVSEAGSNQFVPPHLRAASALVPSAMPSKSASPRVPPHLRSAPQQSAIGTPAPVVAPHTQKTTLPTGTATTVPPHLRPVPKIGNNASPRASREANTTLKLESSRVLPPHLRKVTPTQSVTHSDNTAASSQASQNLQQAHIVEPRLDTLESALAQAENLTLASREAPTPPISIYFETDASLSDMQGERGVQALIPGRTFLYQYPNRETVIWEMRADDGRVIREDVRSIFQVWETGSTAVMRRTYQGRLRVNSIRLESLRMVKTLIEEIARQRTRLQSCSDPIYPSTEDTGQHPRTIDTSTLLPLLLVDESPRSENVLPVLPSVEINPKPSDHCVKNETSVETAGEFEHDGIVGTESKLEAAKSPEVEDSKDSGLMEGRPLENPTEEGEGGEEREEIQKQTKHEDGSLADFDVMKQVEAEDQKRGEAESNENDKLEAEIKVEIDAENSVDQRGILIDTGPTSPEPERRSHADDLEGLVYDCSVSSLTTPTERILSAANEQGTNTPSAVKSEPDIKSEKDSDVSGDASLSLVLIDTKDTKGPQVAQSTPTADKAINGKLLKNTPVGIDLNKSGMAVLATLDIERYRNISRAFDTMLDALKRSGMYHEGSVEEFTAVQVVLIHLARSGSFKTLSFEEQVKVAAVVFHNLYQLKCRPRLRYTQAQILGLKGYARPRPPVADLLKEIVALARRINGPRSTLLSPSFISDGASSPRPSPRQSPRLSPNSPASAPSRSRSPHTPGRLTPPPDSIPAKDEKTEHVFPSSDAKEEKLTPPSKPTTSQKPPAALTERTNRQAGSSLPPHLRGVGYSLGQSGLGGSRWA